MNDTLFLFRRHHTNRLGVEYQGLLSPEETDSLLMERAMEVIRITNEFSSMLLDEIILYYYYRIKNYSFFKSS